MVIGEAEVVRPAHYWTPTVQALLQYLRGTGLDCVPAPLGMDGRTERVSYLPGDSGADGWRHAATEEGLASAAVLLRRVHDATVGWRPPEDAVWALPARAPAEVVCHGDPGPWNGVWRDCEALALIDWDFAHPGPRLDDVAYACEYLVPFRDDEEAMRWLGYTSPPDRGSRLRSFVRSYGWPAIAALSTTDLLDAVIRRQEQTIRDMAVLADAGVEPQVQWRADGALEVMAGQVRWSRTHRSLFE